MTIGQRIAQKRKELALSQEALGERMGVSRQAIYKWESDAALPEIDKLVSLSKLFGVSVGWLLCVEEDAGPGREQQEPLDQTTLDMVEQIVRRYIEAQPKPKPRKRWLMVIAAAAAVLAGIALFEHMEQLYDRYTDLQIAVSSITGSVNSQISGIAGRVEDILNAQNNLTAEFDTEIVNTDYRSGTLTIAMKAVPKTYTQGMDAVFVVDFGEGPVEFESEFADSHTFTCEATVPLTDRITASVVFISADGTRQTQVLDSYRGMLADSYASVDFHYDVFSFTDEFRDGTYALRTWYVTLLRFQEGKGDAQIKEYRVGVFRNQRLLAWGEPCARPSGYVSNQADEIYFQMPPLTLEDLTAGETIEIAALVTDTYGRQYVISDIPNLVCYDAQGVGSFTWPNVFSSVSDPSQWDLQ